MVHAFEKVVGKKVPYSIGPRRPGDISECYANPTKAEKMLGWKAKKVLKKCVMTLGNGKYKTLMDIIKRRKLYNVPLKNPNNRTKIPS